MGGRMMGGPGYEQEELISEKIPENIDVAEENIAQMESYEEVEEDIGMVVQQKQKKNELIIHPIEVKFQPKKPCLTPE